MLKAVWSIFFGLFLCASSAFSQDEKWTHYGLRPLGMGNAFIAVADDFNALFYNPAGLARLKTWDGELINPSFEISKTTSTFLSEIQSLAGAGKSDTEEILNLLEKQTGAVQHVAFGLTPHLVFPHFGFGIGTEISATFIFHRYPTVSLDAGPRLTVPIAYAHSFFEERLSLGLGIRGHVRGGIDRDFTIEDIDAFKTKKEEGEDTPELEDYFEGGTAVGVDFGLLFTPIKVMEPTLGLSITDIGGAKYNKMNVGGTAIATPRTELPSVNTGISFKPLQGRAYYLLVASDVHSINQPFSFSKKWNIGVELGLGSLFKVQTGLHQGYLSGGFQFDVGILNLRAVTYAEEMGPTAGSLEDRRYALQLKLII